MQAAKHPSFELESERVDLARNRIQVQIARGRSPETEDLRHQTVDPASQAMANYALRRADEFEAGLAVENPLRGRFDIRSGFEDALEIFYLALSDLDELAPGVRAVDWRADIANLFYDAAVGAASYEAPGGTQDVRLLLRRGLRSDRGVLVDISDIEVLAGYTPDGQGVTESLIADEFLISLLNSPAGHELKEIIGTIQREQHAFIRAPFDRPVVLQAVAGSGKSTVALHRLAQILYVLRHRHGAAGPVAVFGPTEMLVAYVANLLPTLLESGAQHHTFMNWALTELFGEIKPKRKGDRPRIALWSNLSTERREAMRFKGSLAFKELLDIYLVQQAERRLKIGPVTFAPTITCPEALLHEWYAMESHRPYKHRLDSVGHRLREWVRTQVVNHSAEIVERIANVRKLIEERVAGYTLNHPELELGLRHVGNFRDIWLQSITRQAGEVADGFRLADAVTLYRELMTDTRNFAPLVPWTGAKVQAWCHMHAGLGSVVHVKEKGDKAKSQGAKPEPPDPGEFWDEADLAAIMYIHTRIHGVPDARRWAHVVVDEGQDWSPLHYAVIREWMVEESITIVGDLAQGINGPLGLGKWEELAGTVFGDQMSVTVVNQSYRLTYETLGLAVEILKRGGLEPAGALTAFRHGDGPTLLSVSTEEAATAHISRWIRPRLDGQRSMAVLVPSRERGQVWLEALQNAKLPCQALQDGGIVEGKVMVGTPYLAKGLEFDYVVVVDANPIYFPHNTAGAKHLYVAVTRAKQAVMVVSIGEPSPLLPPRGQDRI